ncbi:BrnA antitoxin family protein [Variovorax sp. LT2P21]|uniref:BrnA antitoxin family protein n=1 Tax=Variovorax sp. LT2P21 TaxID=3443731 RepID=UPI003F45E576
MRLVGVDRAARLCCFWPLSTSDSRTCRRFSWTDRRSKRIAEAIKRQIRELNRGLPAIKTGRVGKVHSRNSVQLRKACWPLDSKAAQTKQPWKLRLESDVLEALRATGDCCQTCIYAMLRVSLRLAGRLPDYL